MGLRVAKASIILIIAGISVSGFAVARSLDWQLEDHLPVPNQGFVGPLLPVESAIGAGISAYNLSTRNAEIAEAQFGYVPGLDVSKIGAQGVGLPIEDMSGAEQATLYAAYSHYLASRTTAQNALEIETAPSVRQIELTGKGEAQIALADENGGANISEAISTQANDGQPILPVMQDIDAPVPHTLSYSRVQTTNHAIVEIVSQNTPQFQPVSVAVALGEVQMEMVAPTPRPAWARPIVQVRPADVRIVQAARDVSVDRLVHVQARGSWPRRLDQINALNGDNIFMQNWGQRRYGNNRTFSRLPNGFIIVGVSK